MKEKVFVTGGAGYIGSILVPRLLADGFRVTVLDNFMFGQTSLLECCSNPNFQIINGDVRDNNLLRGLVTDADIIIPLAALVGAPMCARSPEDATSINLNSIKAISELVTSSQWILMPVTNSGYGIGDEDKLCTEESPLRPLSIYGKTKVQAEEIILSRDNSISFRLATVFGMAPRMRLDLLVNDFTYRAVNDRSLVIFEGHFKRNYIHIRDVADVFVHALLNFESMSGRCYNVGLDDANLSKLELCAEIKKIVPSFTFVEAPFGEDPDKRNYIVSNERLRRAGYVASRTLRDGIEELIKGFSIIKNNKFSNV